MLEPHLRQLVADILRGLKGYHDNFSIVDRFSYFYENDKKKKNDPQGRRAALNQLLEDKLVTVEGRGRWRIAIENRYALEQMARKLGLSLIPCRISFITTLRQVLDK